MNGSTSVSQGSAVGRDLPRSPVLNQFRLNPFRVLRLPIDTGPDEAIWKAEELLTLLRAGVPASEPDLFPWLPEPDEPEIRQAVQAVEEPLRRLVEQLLWFDLQADPAGEAVRLALGDPQLPDSAPDSPEPEMIEGMAPALNRANLGLLIAAMSIHDDGAGDWPEASGTPPAMAWTKVKTLEMAINPHELDLSGGRRRLGVEIGSGLWREAVRAWAVMLKDPALMDHVRRSIERLGDDTVDEGDAEVVINAISTRRIDLIVGEIKVQVIDGRWERVRLLLDVARQSGFEDRRWAVALRPLRQIFRSEALDLEPLLGDPAAPRFDDISLYLARLGTLARRWEGLDPSGWLGLGETVDEAVGRALTLIANHEHYGAILRLKSLLSRAKEVASADSMKGRIDNHATRLDGLSRWECHFCRSREMDPQYSAVLTGKKETHRTRSFNQTTIHYLIKRDILQRCERCADIHAFFHKTAGWVAIGLAIPFTIVCLVVLFRYLAARQNTFNYGQDWGFPAVVGLSVIGFLYIGSGCLIARRIAAMILTPRKERRYWNYKESRQYKALRVEHFGEFKLDFRKNAFAKLVADGYTRNSIRKDKVVLSQALVSWSVFHAHSFVHAMASADTAAWT